MDFFWARVQVNLAPLPLLLPNYEERAWKYHYALWEVQNVTLLWVCENNHLCTVVVTVNGLNCTILLATPSCGAWSLASLNEDRFTHILRGSGGGIALYFEGSLLVIPGAYIYN